MQFYFFIFKDHVQNETIRIVNSSTVTQKLRKNITTEFSIPASTKENSKATNLPHIENNESENVNINDIDECMHLVDCHIVENIQSKVEKNVVNPLFTATLDFALGPFERLIEKKFCTDFNNIKKQALASGEYFKRFDQNQEEIGDAYNIVKEFLAIELNSLGLQSPIGMVDVEKMTKGEVTMFHDGKLRIFKIPQDNEDLKALVGYKVRFFDYK